jgi:hypothetical protein
MLLLPRILLVWFWVPLHIVWCAGSRVLGQLADPAVRSCSRITRERGCWWCPDEGRHTDAVGVRTRASCVWEPAARPTADPALVGVCVSCVGVFIAPWFVSACVFPAGVVSLHLGCVSSSAACPLASYPGHTIQHMGGVSGHHPYRHTLSVYTHVHAAARCVPQLCLCSCVQSCSTQGRRPKA